LNITINLNIVIMNKMSILQLLRLPIVELLFFKKATKGVVKYFLSRLLEFILL
jgi:hypothetical protein